MRILAIADEESKYLWDYFQKVPKVFSMCFGKDVQIMSFICTNYFIFRTNFQKVCTKF